MLILAMKILAALSAAGFAQALWLRARDRDWTRISGYGLIVGTSAAGWVAILGAVSLIA